MILQCVTINRLNTNEHWVYLSTNFHSVLPLRIEEKKSATEQADLVMAKTLFKVGYAYVCRFTLPMNVSEEMLVKYCVPGVWAENILFIKD